MSTECDANTFASDDHDVSFGSNRMASRDTIFPWLEHISYTLLENRHYLHAKYRMCMRVDGSSLLG